MIPKRWIYIKGIGGKTVADAAAIAIEKVGRDDLEVVVGGMGESTLAVAVAERPDAGHARAQLVVDLEVRRRRHILQTAAKGTDRRADRGRENHGSL
jgi:hypothetical protein